MTYHKESNEHKAIVTKCKESASRQAKKVDNEIWRGRLVDHSPVVDLIKVFKASAG